jgi:hypothetical protein
MSPLRELLDVLGPRKDFGGRFVGSPTLNRLGLHPARIALSDACLWARRRQLAPLGLPPELAPLVDEGVAAIPGFLEGPVLEAVRAEARARVAAAAELRPAPRPTVRGFGPREPFDGGFDRFDGDTLNRFVEIDPARTPACAAAVRAPRLARLCAAAAGFRHQPERFRIYETVHGGAPRYPDPQKDLHRDTFHSTIKAWLFLDDVRPEDGPFEYVPGSHRMDARRYRWEHARALATIDPSTPWKGGAFRIDAAGLADLGLPPPRSLPVAANTLVLADTRGFHRRGDGRPGARRLALYASLRSWPFSPVAY